MWAAATKFLFTTPMGRGVLLGGSIAIGMAAGWYIFSTHYFDEGVAKCNAEHLDRTNKANVAQAAENAKKNKTSSDVAKAATDAGNTVSKDTEQSVTKAKGEIEDVYKKPPVTAPVAIGSCVHPVDDRVQDRIGDARRAANDAGGSL